MVHDYRRKRWRTRAEIVFARFQQAKLVPRIESAVDHDSAEEVKRLLDETQECMNAVQLDTAFKNLNRLKRFDQRRAPTLVDGDGHPTSSDEQAHMVLAKNSQETLHCTPMPFAEIVEKAQAHLLDQAHSVCGNQLDLRLLRSISDEIEALSKAARYRASSVDGVPGELIAAAAEQLALHTHPLTMKCAVWCAEPIQESGGQTFLLRKRLRRPTM